MADPSKSAGDSSTSSSESETKKNYDEELDFFSTKFNPERALHSSNVLVPYPKIKTFQTVKSYEDAVKRRQQQGKSKPESVQESVQGNRTDAKSSRSCEKTHSVSSKVTKHPHSESFRSSENQLRRSYPPPRSNESSIEKPSSNIIKSKEISTHSQSSSTSSLPRKNEKQVYASSGKDRKSLHAPSSSSERSLTSSPGHTEKSLIATSRNTDKSLSASSRSTEKLYLSSKSQKRSSSYGQASKSDEKSFNVAIKIEEMENPIWSTNVKIRTDAVNRSRERPSSSLSRKAEIHFHTSIGSEDKASAYSAPKMESQESFQAKGSSSHGGEVHQTQLTECNQMSDIKIEFAVDQKEGTSVAGITKGRSVKKRNIFTRMESMTGPLHVLTRCVQERLHVRVMTRGAVSVRGICRGYIVAFDKHFNMAMIDVEEIYRRNPALGKVKSRRSHKLLAAQKTLQKEKEESQAKWHEEREMTSTSIILQDLTIKPEMSEKDQSLLSAVSQIQENTLVSVSITSGSQLHQTGQALSKSVTLSSAPRKHSSSGSWSKPSKGEAEVPLKALSQSSQAKLQRIRSVYDGLKAPLSPFEREALMLGIPDENVNHRHVNQMFIRGENVVSVSIINDF